MTCSYEIAPAKKRHDLRSTRLLYDVTTDVVLIVATTRVTTKISPLTGFFLVVYSIATARRGESSLRDSQR